MGTTKAPDSKPVARPADDIDLSESVAGEEDPGASIDIVGTPAEPAAADQDKPKPGKERQAG